jgi:hypothetical protein
MSSYKMLVKLNFPKNTKNSHFWNSSIITPRSRKLLRVETNIPNLMVKNVLYILLLHCKYTLNPIYQSVQILNIVLWNKNKIFADFILSVHYKEMVNKFSKPKALKLHFWIRKQKLLCIGFYHKINEQCISSSYLWCHLYFL